MLRKLIALDQHVRAYQRALGESPIRPAAQTRALVAINGVAVAYMAQYADLELLVLREGSGVGRGLPEMWLPDLADLSFPKLGLGSKPMTWVVSAENTLQAMRGELMASQARKCQQHANLVQKFAASLSVQQVEMLRAILQEEACPSVLKKAVRP